jgi:hypothetical protein
MSHTTLVEGKKKERERENKSHVRMTNKLYKVISTLFNDLYLIYVNYYK